MDARCSCNNIFIGALLNEIGQGCDNEELCESSVGCDYNVVATLQTCLFCLIQLQDYYPFYYDSTTFSFDFTGTKEKTTATCKTADTTIIIPQCESLYFNADGTPGACAVELAQYLA